MHSVRATAITALLAAVGAAPNVSHTTALFPRLTASHLGGLGSLGGKEAEDEEAEALAAADRVLAGGHAQFETVAEGEGAQEGGRLRTSAKTGRRGRAYRAAKPEHQAPPAEAPALAPVDAPQKPGSASGAPVMISAPQSPLAKYELRAEKRHKETSAKQHNTMKAMVDQIANLTDSLKDMKADLDQVHKKVVPKKAKKAKNAKEEKVKKEDDEKDDGEEDKKEEKEDGDEEEKKDGGQEEKKKPIHIKMDKQEDEEDNDKKGPGGTNSGDPPVALHALKRSGASQGTVAVALGIALGIAL